MKRIKSLDIMRGLTVIMMIIVNNPGDGYNVFKCLTHSPWDGFTVTDLVFPSFLFIVGASVWFAFRKFDHKLNKKAVIKIIRRGILIYVVGILLYIVPFYNFNDHCAYDFSHLRLLGVLPRIGIVYLIGSLLVLSLRSVRKIICTIIGLMVGYTAIVYIFGDATLQGYVGRMIDINIFGVNHVYNSSFYGMPYDPEGLLGTMTSLCTMMIGYLAAMLLSRKDDFLTNIKTLTAAGGLLMLAGATLDYFVPINKPIWSATYVLYAAGIDMMIWGVLAYYYDVKQTKAFVGLCEPFGTNALFVYALSEVVATLVWLKVFMIGDQTIFQCISESFGSFLPLRLASLLGAISLVALCWLVVYPLYRKKIYIKL
jgi:predicted acyltransferase